MLFSCASVRAQQALGSSGPVGLPTPSHAFQMPPLPFSTLSALLPAIVQPCFSAFFAQATPFPGSRPFQLTCLPCPLYHPRQPHTQLALRRDKR